MNPSAKIQLALQFAFDHLGTRENPPGSNRGPDIDAWAREFGSPVGSPWCALAVAKARSVGGLWIPEHDAGSCNAWVAQGRQANVMSPFARLGAAVIYTDHQTLNDGPYAGELHAVHMGIVCEIAPQLLAIEGNTSLDGFSHEGWIQALKPIDPARVLCYIAPLPPTPAAAAAASAPPSTTLDEEVTIRWTLMPSLG